jgi:hypothetical protein
VIARDRNGAATNMRRLVLRLGRRQRRVWHEPLQAPALRSLCGDGKARVTCGLAHLYPCGSGRSNIGQILSQTLTSSNCQSPLTSSLPRLHSHNPQWGIPADTRPPQPSAFRPVGDHVCREGSGPGTGRSVSNHTESEHDHIPHPSRMPLTYLPSSVFVCIMS